MYNMIDEDDASALFKERAKAFSAGCAVSVPDQAKNDAVGMLMAFAELHQMKLKVGISDDGPGAFCEELLESCGMYIGESAAKAAREFGGKPVRLSMTVDND